ncbi:MAG: glycosyl transferase, partial [Lactobacillus sp.]|nr:glycosyl transferase [Lactobacillus sp.]
GPADLIQDGQSGFIVPSGHVDDLAAKIKEYFANPALMEQLNEGAYQNAQRFSGDSIWKEWEKYVINA